MTKDEVVKCVFGGKKQKVARMIDPEWCREHCKADNGYERGKRAYDCFWHFTDMGMDMRKE